MRHLGLVVVLLAACAHSRGGGGGGGGGGDDDGSGSGSGSDTIPPSDVQVFVHDGFAPIANVRVVFDGADGTRSELTTDATGRAMAAMATGGDVTVIRTYPVSTPQKYTEVYNWIGVRPGEQLNVGHVVDDITPPTTINVLVPAAAQGTVKVVTPCGSGQGRAPSVAVAVAACPANLSLYVADSNQEGFVAYAPYAATVDLSTEILYGNLSTTLLAYDVTPALSSVTAEGRAVDGTHTLYSTGTKRVDQQSTQIDMADLAGVIDELVVGTIVASAGGTQMVATRTRYEPMPVSVDASADLIPALPHEATYTPASVTWVEQGTGTVDAVLATIEVTRGDPGAKPADAKYTRTIIAPYTGMTLAIPQLTGLDATYNPLAADELAGAVGLVHSTAGYDALRTWAFAVSNIIDATTPGDTVTLSYPGNNPPTL